MRKFILIPLLLLIGCTKNTDIYIPAGFPEECDGIPKDMIVDNPCITERGRWTYYEMNKDTHHARMYCNQTERRHYLNQEEFDAAHSNGISNHDYFLSDRCAFGSFTENTENGPVARFFLWKRN